MRISDWSSDVCSSDLLQIQPEIGQVVQYVTACVVVTLFGCHRSSSYRRYAYRIQPAPVPATRLVDKLRRSPAGREIARRTALQIGRASCREKVCQYVWTSVVAVSLKNKTTTI